MASPARLDGLANPGFPGYPISLDSLASHGGQPIQLAPASQGSQPTLGSQAVRASDARIGKNSCDDRDRPAGRYKIYTVFSILKRHIRIVSVR